MRTLLAVVMFLGGLLALNDTADAARKSKRIVKQPQYYPQYYYAPKADSVCEQRAWHEDPTGLYAGYPCWAREAFGRGSRGGHGR